MRAYVIVTIAAMILHLPFLSALAADTFTAELQDATTSQRLELLLTRYPERASEILPKLESQLLEEVKAQGKRNRFVVKEIVPLSGFSSGRVTMTGIGKEGVANVEGDLELTVGVSGGQVGLSMPWGKDSIHRFVGKVEITPKYTFIGEGDDSHRLTFGLLEGVGYVYLRGKGRVVSKQGKEVKLGYSQE